MDNGTIIFNNVKDQPTIEGPKFLKKDGFYYIFAPAGVYYFNNSVTAVSRSKGVL